MQPLLDAPPPVHPYAKGSWGPDAAHALVAGHGRWHGPWVAPSDGDRATVREATVCTHESSSSRSREDDPAGGLDQREVGERLREVAEVTGALGLELLGVQTERGCDPQEALHHVAGARRSRR